MENEMVKAPEADETIVLPVGVKVTATSLTIPEDTTIEQWQDIGTKLHKMDHAVQFWIGDWCNFGERKWGEKYKEAIKVTGLAYDTVQRYAQVARRTNSGAGSGIDTISTIQRHEKLDFALHQEVAALSIIAANKLLDEAEKDKWSRQELRGAVKLYREEHGFDRKKKKPVMAFSWFHEARVEAMLDGMQAIRAGVTALTHDQRDPDVAKSILQNLLMLITEISNDIKEVLGED